MEMRCGTAAMDASTGFAALDASHTRRLISFAKENEEA